AALLAERHDADAIAAYRAALEAAEAGTSRRSPFGAASPRARALIERAGLGDSRAGVLKYRRALAQHLTQRGLWEQGLAEWDRALAASGAGAPDHFGRALALDGLGRRDDALEEYRRAVSLDARSVTYGMRLARRLWESDQYFQAINAWRNVI